MNSPPSSHLSLPLPPFNPHPHLCLEAGEQVDEERMTDGVGHFEDAFLSQQRVDLVAGDDVSLLQGLDGKVLCSVLVLAQDDLKKKRSDYT